mmetsp:Transcript_36060/g.93652  ORF Transcript_36060/g.93652 Transcript_36060/m.93652 type:complete len:160 (-) Transcript_36060:219-698(-)
MHVPASLALPADGDARLNLCAVATLSLALLTSAAEPDVSGAIAVLGLVGAAVGSAPLLKLYVLLTPASITVDIIRLAIAPHRIHGFFIFLDVLEMLAKIGGTYYGYSHWKVLSGLESMGSPNQPFSGNQAAGGQSGYSPPQDDGGAPGLHFDQADHAVV